MCSRRCKPNGNCGQICKKQSYLYWQLQCTAITITNLLLMWFQWWEFILNMFRFLNNETKPSQLNFHAFRHILFSSVCRMSLAETSLMWSPQAQNIRFGRGSQSGKSWRGSNSLFQNSRMDVLNFDLWNWSNANKVQEWKYRVGNDHNRFSVIKKWSLKTKNTEIMSNVSLSPRILQSKQWKLQCTSELHEKEGFCLYFETVLTTV